MSRKLKFKPEIRRIKLNPEQAVLTCDCFDGGFHNELNVGTHWIDTGFSVTVCSGGRGGTVNNWGCGAVGGTLNNTAFATGSS